MQFQLANIALLEWLDCPFLGDIVTLPLHKVYHCIVCAETDSYSASLICLVRPAVCQRPSRVRPAAQRLR